MYVYTLLQQSKALFREIAANFRNRSWTLNPEQSQKVLTARMQKVTLVACILQRKAVVRYNEYFTRITRKSCLEQSVSRSFDLISLALDRTSRNFTHLQAISMRINFTRSFFKTQAFSFFSNITMFFVPTRNREKTKCD